MKLPKDEIIAFCKRHQVAKLSLFGSMVRGDATPESDVDMLIEFLPGVHVGYFHLVAMELELSDLLGKKVDLHTPHELSMVFRDEVLEHAIPQYVC